MAKNPAMPRATGLLILLFACFAGWPAAGQSDPPCAVCGNPIKGTVWKYKQWRLCEACTKLPDSCNVCGLPIREVALRTADGRAFCKKDGQNLLLTSEQGRELFERTRRELGDIIGQFFALKNPEVVVNVFDIDYWNDQIGKKTEGKMRRTGFSVSRRAGDRIQHNVLLLSGHPVDEMAAVCAHEYTHLWINENRAEKRELDQDTIEGICELIAHLLMGQKQLPDQQEEIRKNTYTNGKILTMLDVERECGLNYILDWIKTGTNATLDVQVMKRFQAEQQAAPLVYAPAAPRPPAPTTLTLKALLGGKRKIAIINGESFEKGDEASLRLGEKSVLVRCLDITDNSVILTVDGSDKPITLRMDGR
jgi:hypothetical protein